MPLRFSEANKSEILDALINIAELAIKLHDATVDPDFALSKELLDVAIALRISASLLSEAYASAYVRLQLMPKVMEREINRELEKIGA